MNAIRTPCRRATLAAMLPESDSDDVDTLDEFLSEAYPNVHPNDLPPGAFRWLFTGDGSPPHADSLVALYDSLTDSRKMDLFEAAKIIKITSASRG